MRAGDKPRRFEMGQPVIFLFMGSMKKSWSELSEEEQSQMMAKVGASRDEVGGKGIVGAWCEWSTPDYQFFGVEEYPSIDALRKHIAAQREMGFTDHLEETYVVGRRWESQADDG
jgi:hypothetical protein